MKGAKLSLQQMIGQHVVCGFPSIEMDRAFIDAVKTHKIANVILFSRNIANKTQLVTLCTDIQDLVQNACATPAFITIDQEGGMVSRLSSDCTITPSAMALAGTDDVQLARQAGIITAEELRALGVNVDFAPSLDVNSNPHNPVIGVRSFGDTARTVERFALPFLEGIQECGVMAVGKHFPGHGDTHLDSHLALPTVIGDLAALQEHLAPFKAAIVDGIQGIMTSHILFPGLESERVPATLSRSIITGLLKQEFGFKGLVFSDCLEMDAVAKQYTTEISSVKALQAGVDVLCISHHVELGCQAVKAIEDALLQGRLDRKEFEASTNKILAAKQMLSEQPVFPLSVVGSDEHARINADLYERSLTLVNDVPFHLGFRPLFIGPRCFAATTVSSSEYELVFSREMAHLFDADWVECSENPDAGEIARILETAQAHSSVVMGTYNAHQYPAQAALANALADSADVCVIALRDPYDLSLLDRRIRSFAGYAYKSQVCRAFARLLKEEIRAQGRLPVTL
ncbi:glycoside hydrolase family 3 protein [Sphaerochaeta sp.]|uniref:glycoside hydrolase family 3 protein n=1 Tax=Sphaerochaeta sp. TaxID=1972642 RepID=UPI002FC8120C